MTVTSADRGLASRDPLLLAEQTAAAWGAFRDGIDQVDVHAPTRVKKEWAGAVIAKVGEWPQSRQLPQILADAKEGNTELIDQDEIDARVIAAHGKDDRSELLDGVTRARNSLLEWVQVSGPQQIEAEALLPVGSPLGVLPVMTYLHAASFQLAVAARDMAKAGAQANDELLAAGLRALVDTTGALAARMGMETEFAVITPLLSIVTVTKEGGWTVEELSAPPTNGDLPGLEGEAGLLLDIASGRRNPVLAMRGKKIKMNQPQRLMKLSAIAAENPGLPGGAVLRRAAPIIGALSR